MNCDQCEMLAINGIATHETGCSNAWRGQRETCHWCGMTFQPEAKGEIYCSEDCAESAL